MTRFCLHCKMEIKRKQSIVQVQLRNSPNVARYVHTACYEQFRLSAPVDSIIGVFAPLDK